jgi:hypothetical protein
MRSAGRLTVGAFILLLLGCVSSFSGLIFSLPNGQVDARGKTVAVVAAVDNDVNVAVAESMARSLEQVSTFKVMPAKQVEKRIPNYPPTVKGPYNSAYMTIDIDYSKTDTKKVRDIMKKLGTDYVYVIWIPTGYSRTVTDQGTGATSGEGRVYSAVAQMFQGPAAKVAGQGKFTVTSSKIRPGARVSDKDVQDAIQSTTETVAKIIAEKTGTLKQQ